MKAVMIVAADEDNIIGHGNKLPWRLPGDLRRFKALTMGHVVVMGRRTRDSIQERLRRDLPGRTSVVLSRSRISLVPETLQVYNLEDAMALAKDVSEKAGRDRYFVIGGLEVYKQFLPEVEAVELTRVNTRQSGDVRLPVGWLDPFLLETEEVAGDGESDFSYRFLSFRRAY